MIFSMLFDSLCNNGYLYLDMKQELYSNLVCPLYSIPAIIVGVDATFAQQVLNVSVLIDSKHPIKCASRLIRAPIISLRSVQLGSDQHKEPQPSSSADINDRSVVPISSSVEVNSVAINDRSVVPISSSVEVNSVAINDRSVVPISSSVEVNSVDVEVVQAASDSGAVECRHWEELLDLQHGDSSSCALLKAVVLALRIGDPADKATP